VPLHSALHCCIPPTCAQQADYLRVLKDGSCSKHLHGANYPCRGDPTRVRQAVKGLTFGMIFSASRTSVPSSVRHRESVRSSSRVRTFESC